MPLVPKPYSQAEVLAYWEVCEQMVDDAVDALDLQSPESGFHWYKVSKLEHQLINLRHIQHHAAQLADRLRAAEGIGIRWVGARRFTPTNNNLAGFTGKTDWAEGWTTRAVTPEAWVALKRQLRDDYARISDKLRKLKRWDEDSLGESMAIAVHSAYHLGAIRQLAKAVRDMNVSLAVQAAWQANQRVNKVLLEHLSPEMLDARTPGGGYTVAQHLAHMTQAIKYWGSLRDAGFADLPDPYFDYNPKTHDFKAETDLGKVRAAMTRTWAQALEAPDVAGPSEESVEPPHPTTDAFLIHMMVHDAHHRGQILLALKTSGHPLPDEDALWGAVARCRSGCRMNAAVGVLVGAMLVISLAVRANVGCRANTSFAPTRGGDRE